MATIIPLQEAETTLPRLVERALAGETVILARDGRPLVRLVPVRVPEAPRRPGRLRGRVRMAPDFDRTPDDVIDAFASRSA